MNFNAPETTSPPSPPRRPRQPRKAEDYDNRKCISDPNLTPTDARGNPWPAIGPTDMPIEIILARLRRVGGGSHTWSACCPAHSDSNPSLSITEESDGTILMKCHVDCKVEDIMTAIGLKMSFLFPSPFAQQSAGSKYIPKNDSRCCALNLPAQEPVIDYFRFESLIKGSKATTQQLARLAEQLRIPCASLSALEVGYDALQQRWLFPERDDLRRVVGVVYREANGGKQCAPGSKRGLTIPSDFDRFDRIVEPLYIAEGATDTASLHGIGKPAIGRSSALGSSLLRLWLVRFIQKHRAGKIIVVGDRDLEKNGKSPGKDGAIALAQFLAATLQRSICWALPSAKFKDVREQIAAGEWKTGLEVKAVQS